LSRQRRLLLLSNNKCNCCCCRFLGVVFLGQVLFNGGGFQASVHVLGMLLPSRLGASSNINVRGSGRDCQRKMWLQRRLLDPLRVRFFF
jgi:hypothetical protein